MQQTFLGEAQEILLQAAVRSVSGGMFEAPKRGLGFGGKGLGFRVYTVYTVYWVYTVYRVCRVYRVYRVKGLGSCFSGLGFRGSGIACVFGGIEGNTGAPNNYE